MSKSASRGQVIQVCIHRFGFREGRKVAQFIFEWEIVVTQLGRKISADDFAAWWKDSRSQSYARLARFRAAFPELGEHGKPDDLMTLRPGENEVSTAINLGVAFGALA